MLEKVKLALRIRHNLLDEDIRDTINAARAELIRSGIKEEIANSDNDSLATSAIKAYCMFTYASDPKMQEGYFNSWQYQIDCMRKSDKYKAGGDNA